MLISASMQKIKLDETSKLCPNPECQIRYDTKKIKCPSCNVFYRQFLNDVKQNENNEAVAKYKYCSSMHYDHIESCHPAVEYETLVLDPLMANPNSKTNILVMANHVFELAEIRCDKNNEQVPRNCVETGVMLEPCRKSIYISADAAIALQV